MQSVFADIDAEFPRLARAEPTVFADARPLMARRLVHGRGGRGQCLDNPTWRDVHAALLRLDNRDDVLIELREAYPYLVVAGRPERYLVAVGLEVGGQPIFYPADLAVDLATVIQAVRWFAERGLPAPSLRWVEDPA